MTNAPFFSPSSAFLNRKKDRIGILLLNLGTPDDTSVSSVRKYLREFLSDRRVIEISPFKWKIILNTFVLPTRPKHVSENYKRIWDKQKDASPLRVITEQQTIKLAKKLGKDTPVAWAMRYGKPNSLEACNELLDQGCTRIVAIPMYPQYSATTVATANDALFDALKKLRVQPAVHTVPSFPDHPLYIKALADSVRESFKKIKRTPEKLLLSFHGIPLSYEQAGDPYRDECKKTHKAVQKALKGIIAPENILLTFQSRFGKAEWLTPYTDHTVQELAKDGVKDIAVMTPGFMADCLETIDEIAREVKEEFLESGGNNFTFIPCINDKEATINLLEALSLKAMSGF